MTRATNRLTALQIKSAPPGKYQDGAGLILDKSDEIGGKWIYRYSITKGRREMGLGAYPAVSLSDARRSRDRWAAVLAEGRDPITERARIMTEEKAARDRKDPPLSEVVDTVFAASSATLGQSVCVLRFDAPPERGWRGFRLGERPRTQPALVCQSCNSIPVAAGAIPAPLRFHSPVTLGAGMVCAAWWDSNPRPSSPGS